MESTKKTPGFAWAVLVVVYLLSVMAAMFWFSCPPMADPIIVNMILPITEDAVSAFFGNLMSYLAIGAFVGAIVVTFAQNKLGVKNILIISAVFMVVGSLLAAMSGTNYWMLAASRLVGGFGVGCVATSATTAVSLWFEDDFRGVALAIWATWVPVATLIAFNVVMIPINGGADFHLMWWVDVVFAVICLLLVVFVYKMPTGGSISTEATKLTDGLKYLANRQVIGVILAMFFFTFLNNCFITYNTNFFQDGLGMDATTANFISSLTLGLGVLAPLFGIFYNFLKKHQKFVTFLIGGIAYLAACALGFKDLGTAGLVVWLVCMVIGNNMMNASVRPTMPMLVAHGGFTAITCGLSAITFLEFFGQTLTGLFGTAVDALGYSTASMCVMIPGAIIMIIAGLMVKGKKED